MVLAIAERQFAALVCSIGTISLLLYLRYVSGNHDHYRFFDDQINAQFDTGLRYAVSALRDRTMSCFVWSMVQKHLSIDILEIFGKDEKIILCSR
jgi:hypothetical protein